MSIIDTIYSYLPAKKKLTPSNWVKFNAVCCHHLGNTADTRARAGVIRTGEQNVSYSCFNCGFKASYQVGRPLSRKMKQLLGWMGASDDAITKLTFEALKLESDEVALAAISLTTFEEKPLPEDALLISEETINDETIPAIEYVYSRGLTLASADFYTSNSMPNRIIIPFTIDGKNVGYTGRKLGEGKPKYLSDQPIGFVFNLDAQAWTNKYVFVVEGPMDALSVGGVALLHAEITDKQATLINRLQKQVVLIPDRDSAGRRTVDQAIELGWSVSMPEWDDDIKDSNEALRRYGSLYTMYSIVSAIESYHLKIKLRAKQWFNNQTD